MKKVILSICVIFTSFVSVFAQSPKINTLYVENSIIDQVNKLRNGFNVSSVYGNDSLDKVCQKLVAKRFKSPFGLSSHEIDTEMKNMFGNKTLNYTAGFLVVSYNESYQNNEEEIIKLFFERQIEQNEILGLTMDGSKDFNKNLKSKLEMSSKDDGNGNVIFCYIVYHSE